MSGRAVQKCCGADCPRLRREWAKHQEFELRAEAADQAYADNPKAPPGYRNATDADLEKMGVTRGMLESPKDPQTGKPSQFRAVVFMGTEGQPPLVAFRGSQSKEDFTRANIPQGMGKETFHYTQAQMVANRINNSPTGAGANFTGHSLGGGLASAAARTTGNAATTFNAAGLHQNTVKNPSSSPIDAVYVKGEMLRTLQMTPGVTQAAATETWPLDPPPTTGSDLITAGALAVGGPLGGAVAAGAQGYRAFTLHKMESVKQSLANRRNQLAAEMKKKGC
jgi:hypothetical protein